MSLPDKLTAVPEPTEAYLNHKQLVDYRSEREEALTWLLTFGKDPKQADGYAVSTLQPQAYRMDQFYRWMWEREGGYTVQISHEHADDWMRQLAQDDYSSTHKANCQKALKMLFKWWANERNGSLWDPEITRNQGSVSVVVLMYRFSRTTHCPLKSESFIFRPPAWMLRNQVPHLRVQAHQSL